MNPRRSGGQSTSRVTSISLNEMKIRILLSECQAFEWTVQHFSGNLSENDEKKIKNNWEKNVILEILNAVMKRKIHSFIPSINEGNFYGNSEISMAMFKTGM